MGAVSGANVVDDADDTGEGADAGHHQRAGEGVRGAGEGHEAAADPRANLHALRPEGIAHRRGDLVVAPPRRGDADIDDDRRTHQHRAERLILPDVADGARQDDARPIRDEAEIRAHEAVVIEERGERRIDLRGRACHHATYLPSLVCVSLTLCYHNMRIVATLCLPRLQRNAHVSVEVPYRADRYRLHTVLQV